MRCFLFTHLAGTVISLEHHARTHPRIHSWTEEATPSDNSGRIMYLAEVGTVVSSYHAIRTGGLYYLQEDFNFIPVSPHFSVSPIDASRSSYPFGVQCSDTPCHYGREINPHTILQAWRRSIQHISWRATKSQHRTCSALHRSNSTQHKPAKMCSSMSCGTSAWATHLRPACPKWRSMCKVSTNECTATFVVRSLPRM